MEVELLADIKTTISLTDRISGTLRTISGSVNAAKDRMSNLNQEMQKNASIAGRLTGAIGGLVASYGALSAVSGITRLTDEFTNTTARLNLVNDGLQTTEELQNKIFASAQRVGASYSQVSDTVAQLSLRAADAFNSNDQTILFAENLGKLFNIAGAGQQEVASATLQLTQALGSGVLRGEELNAVLEAAPNVIEQIEKYLGVSTAQLREMASNGEITADVVRNALLGATKEINDQFDQMPRTFAQSIQLIKNSALKAFQPIFEQLSKLAASDEFTNIISKAANALSILSSVSVQALTVLGAVASFIYDNWSLISPVLFVVGSTVAFLVTQFVILRTWALLVAGASLVMNAILAANPFTLVALAVIAVIGAMALLINIINRVLGTNISAIGIITGLFAGLFAFLQNNFIGIYNVIASVVEFFANVWTNPVFAVKALFANLATNVIDYFVGMIGSFDGAATALANAFVTAANTAIGAINAIGDALSLIPGVEIGNISKIGKVKSVAGGLTGISNKLKNSIAIKPEGYQATKKLQFKDLGASIKSGYNKGANIGGGDFLGKFSGGDNSLASLMGSVGDVGKNLGGKIDDANKQSKGTKDNTKKLADSAGILVDDLQYLRDLSERKAINRYTTASINVQMENAIDARTSNDLDGIIYEFGTKMEEVSHVLATGGNVDVV